MEKTFCRRSSRCCDIVEYRKNTCFNRLDQKENSESSQGCKADPRGLYLHEISEFVCRFQYLDLHFTVISLRWMNRSVGVFKFHEIGRGEASSLPVMTDW